MNGSVATMQSLVAPLDSAGRKEAARTWFNGLQPLHLAAKGGHVEAARWMLDHDAPIDSAKERELRTPLHWATQRGHLDLVKLLLERGAPVNAGDKTGVDAVQ